MKVKLLVLWVVLSYTTSAFSTSVTLVIPDRVGPEFWALVDHVSKAAAKDLDIDLEVIYGADNRFANLEIIEKVTQRPQKTDYIVFRPFYGNAEVIFNKLEASGIHFVTLEQAFSGEEAKQLQRPKQKYKHWIGEVNFNNVAGGKLLLDALIEALRATQPDAIPSITGLGGDFDNLSLARQQPLVQMQKAGDTILNQVFPTYWNPGNVASNFQIILERYPQTNIFWCAGDQLALETLNQYRILSERPALIGGFDWLPDALLKIKQGEMTASVGGHFLMGAIALTKIVDFDNNIDRFGTQSEPYSFELITQKNIDKYLHFMLEQNWQNVDFKQFTASKTKQHPKALTMQNIIDTYQNIGESYTLKK